MVVSRNSPLCVQNYGAGTTHGNCNENQFSDPFTGPDGNLYVVYSNFNNATASLPGGDDGKTTKKDNHYQLLLSESTDGGKSFGQPVKVADYYEFPDCATYQNGQDAGRACVPEKGPTANSIFRATNISTGVVNPNDPSDVAVVFGPTSTVTRKESSGCTPTGFAGTGNPTYDGVKGTGGCNNDIVISTSSDGGQSFNGTTHERAEAPGRDDGPWPGNHGSVLAVGRLQQQGPARRVLHGPQLRKRRVDRRVGREPVGVVGRTDL